MSDKKKYPYVAFNPFGNQDIRVVVKQRSRLNGSVGGGSYTSRYYTLEASRGKNAMGEQEWMRWGLNDPVAPEVYFLVKSYIEQKLDEIEVPVRSEDGNQ